MKGSELLGQIIALLVLVGISFVAGGIILWTMNITEDTGWGSTYSLTLNPIHQPIKYEAMILSYMEVTHDGVPAKDMIVNSIDNGDPLTDVNVDGKTFDLIEITRNVFDSWFGDEPYILFIERNGVRARVAGSSLRFVDYQDNKISVKTLNIPITTGSSEGALILYAE